MSLIINPGFAGTHTSNAQVSQVMVGVPVPASGNAIQLLEMVVVAKSGSLAAAWTAALAVNWNAGVPSLLAPAFATKSNPSGAPDPTVITGADVHDLLVQVTGVANFEIDWLVKWDGVALEL